MLSFTFGGSRPTGTFNGRFVFRAPLTMNPLSIADLDALASGDRSALEPDVLLHEYLHWMAFTESRFGIETVGRRFRARSEFMRGNNVAVVDYYKQRTAYFCAAYAVHERIVDALETEHRGRELAQVRKARLKVNQVKEISDADRKARIATKELDALSRSPYRIVDFAKGYVATREYGLQNYVPDASGATRIREVSLASKTGGILNQAFETEIGDQSKMVSLLKRIRRSFNTEGRAGGLTKKKMAVWAVLKFSSEARTLGLLESHGYPLSATGFAGYTKQVADFALRYTLDFSWQSPTDLAALLRDCNIEVKTIEQLDYLAERFMAFDDGVLYYFYVHGN